MQVAANDCFEPKAELGLHVALVSEGGRRLFADPKNNVCFMERTNDLGFDPCPSSEECRQYERFPVSRRVDSFANPSVLGKGTTQKWARYPPRNPKPAK